jgi:transposase
MEFKRISIDTSKHVFTIHGVDEQERPILRREIRRAQVEPFFAKLAPTEVVLEACAGSHHWGRVLGGMGHRVRLIPPQYVKPFVKRSKNDRNDAEAINALRGHAAEFGIVAAKGCANVTALLAVLSAEEAIPAIAKAMFEQMGQHVTDLDAKIDALERQLLEQHKANAVSKLLAAIPGVGPITAITMALTVNPANFETGRHFAAWIGLTPREHSTGGKHRLGRISKAGSERLRQLLVVGAMSVIRYAKPGSKSATTWLLQLLERKPRKLAAVALANKRARIIWAMMARGETYRRQPVAA